ncbi:hypothetical protein PAXRUDRAFT_16669 [Paxillus rubicundulus Ve08.2h10]|uniref:Uncharacterized protein n=1 Tax=Paxillus rubicundulus Ve08.2h10 TaxID=930991 RepID=A0A0D0DKR4_9AGAM|nr:hypothetical protein PAXRUDRAFT_16669 [Paxillus rubicundulus Ve08.2h10]
MHARKSVKKLAVDSERGDVSSVSGSEYQPGKGDTGAGKGSKPDETLKETDTSEYEQFPLSWKCKVITDTSSCVLKKQAAAPPSTAKVQPFRVKVKVKAQTSKNARHKHPVHSPLTISSDDTLDLVPAKFQATKQPLGSTQVATQDVTLVLSDVPEECLHDLVQSPGPPFQQHRMDPAMTASTSQVCAKPTEAVNPKDQQGGSPSQPCPVHPGPKSAKPPAAAMSMDPCPPLSQPPTSSTNSQAI